MVLSNRFECFVVRWNCEMFRMFVVNSLDPLDWYENPSVVIVKSGLECFGYSRFFYDKILVDLPI